MAKVIDFLNDVKTWGGFFGMVSFFLMERQKSCWQIFTVFSLRETEHDSMVTYVHPFPLESFYYRMNITIKWAVGRWGNATWGRRTGRSYW